MEDETERKEYEISYVLATEDAVGEVEKELAALGCVVAHKGALAAVKLAYSVKKHASGFFGFAWFSAAADVIKKLNDVLSLKSGVLRFLIVTPPVQPMVREARQQRERVRSTPATAEASKEAASTPESRPQVAPMRAPEVLSNELLEKKLEEILK